MEMFLLLGKWRALLERLLEKKMSTFKLKPSFQLWNFSSSRALVERLPVRKWRRQVIFRNASSTGNVESFSRWQGSGDVK